MFYIFYHIVLPHDTSNPRWPLARQHQMISVCLPNSKSGSCKDFHTFRLLGIKRRGRDHLGSAWVAIPWQCWKTAWAPEYWSQAQAPGFRHIPISHHRSSCLSSLHGPSIPPRSYTYSMLKNQRVYVYMGSGKSCDINWAIVTLGSAKPLEKPHVYPRSWNRIPLLLHLRLVLLGCWYGALGCVAGYPTDERSGLCKVEPLAKVAPCSVCLRGPGPARCHIRDWWFGWFFPSPGIIIPLDCF